MPAFTINTSLAKTIFVVAVIVSLTPFVGPPLAMILGVVLTYLFGNPYEKETKSIAGNLLKISIVCMGFGMNLDSAIEVGTQNLVITLAMISFTLVVGWILGKWLKIESRTAYLISCGTAICGGSAIAAVSPLVKADNTQISTSLGIVFILNTVALVIFPFIGQALEMCDSQFGLWSALAIHDTSSVVGSSASFGNEALQVATTLKLQRALWIIPLSLATVFFVKGEKRKISIPYFILFFIIAMCVGTYASQFKELYSWIYMAGKKGLTITLFLIGAGLSIASIKSTGAKPFLQGVLLWVMVSLVSLGLVSMCWT